MEHVLLLLCVRLLLKSGSTPAVTTSIAVTHICDTSVANRKSGAEPNYHENGKTGERGGAEVHSNIFCYQYLEPSHGRGIMFSRGD